MPLLLQRGSSLTLRATKKRVFMSFESLGLAQPLLRAVASEGYTIPTPIQAQAIPHVMAGSDMLGSAQTGTGKTAAFALPILHRLMGSGEQPKGRFGRRIRCLVLAPTRELALQISESFATYGRHAPLRQTVVFGGVNQFRQVRALQQGVDILIATPGRLCDLMNQGFVDLNSVEIFVLDEADRMLDIGFLPDIRRIKAKLPTQRQTLFFSATMPDAVMDLANSILKDPVRVEIAPVKATTELIDQSVYFVNKAHKQDLLAGFLSTQSYGRAVVFTRTKHGADRVVKQLHHAGIKSDSIHGNKSQNARQRTLQAFKSNKLHVLVATDLAARGIDVDGVTHVFNFDVPHDPETYVHRIGRTGRAGATGQAIMFCDGEERKLVRQIENLTKKPIKVETQLPEGIEGIPLAAPREERRASAPAGKRPAGRSPRSQRGSGNGRPSTGNGRGHGKPFGHSGGGAGGAKKKRPFAGRR
jgi:ATP-dependent RNA helicase RhlE